MPDHFHLLISANNNSIQSVQVGSLVLSRLSNGIRILLSSYPNAINIQQQASVPYSGKNKSEQLDSGSENYPFLAFNYIHQNPFHK